MAAEKVKRETHSLFEPKERPHDTCEQAEADRLAAEAARVAAEEDEAERIAAEALRRAAEKRSVAATEKKADKAEAERQATAAAERKAQEDVERKAKADADRMQQEIEAARVAGSGTPPIDGGTPRGSGTPPDESVTPPREGTPPLTESELDDSTTFAATATPQAAPAGVGGARTRPKKAKGTRAPTVRNPVREAAAAASSGGAAGVAVGPELKSDDDLTKQDEEKQATGSPMPGAFRLPGIGGGTLRGSGGGPKSGGQNVLTVGSAQSFGQGQLPKFDPSKVTLRKSGVATPLADAEAADASPSSSDAAPSSPFMVKLKSSGKTPSQPAAEPETSSSPFTVKLKSVAGSGSPSKSPQASKAPESPPAASPPGGRPLPPGPASPAVGRPLLTGPKAGDGASREELQERARARLEKRAAKGPTTATEATNKEWNRTPKSAIDALANDEPSFSVLDLSENTVFSMKHREYCEQIGQALRSNTHVTEVRLSRCTLDAADAKAIATGLERNDAVEVLHLDNNKISNDGASVIAEALKTNTRLVELNLLGQPVQFGDACLEQFIDMFNYNVTLTKIIWRLDSRKSFAINKLIVRNNTIKKWMGEGKDVSTQVPASCNVPELKLLNLAGKSGSGSPPPAAAPAPAAEDEVSKNVSLRTLDYAKGMCATNPHCHFRLCMGFSGGAAARLWSCLDEAAL
jgi:hypothetical protein